MDIIDIIGGLIVLIIAIVIFTVMPVDDPNARYPVGIVLLILAIVSLSKGLRKK